MGIHTRVCAIREDKRIITVGIYTRVCARREDKRITVGMIEDGEDGRPISNSACIRQSIKSLF